MWNFGCSSRLRFLNSLGSLRKHDVDGSENVIWKCNIAELFKVSTVAKCVLTIQELNSNQRFRDKKTKLNICHHVLTSSSQLQNRTFHVVERTRTSAECPKMKNARANRENLLFFTVKYANLWRSCCRCRRGCVNSLMLSENPAGLSCLRTNRTVRKQTYKQTSRPVNVGWTFYCSFPRQVKNTFNSVNSKSLGETVWLILKQKWDIKEQNS